MEPQDYEKLEEIKTKKLVRKITFILFGMVFILASIIIIEFKEFSNNYNEYKIGQNELGPNDLVWAGIMGTSPRYYESPTKYGLGYSEFETREIRKALEEAGINLIYRYMSPNRLEFEFERKHPICFYDRTWSNPKEYFKKKRHPILSIPLFLSGNEKRKIFFRKGEKDRFTKHLDSKGNIILDSLIKDQSLKTELIRKVDYDGPYSLSNISYGKKQLDNTYYDHIKDKYKKNIDFVILHTNDQIIQMLGRKRFDYQFYKTLEYDDYEWIDGKEEGIETLIYQENYINSIDDPHLIFHSVACGNHPLSKKAMPIINEVISTLRFNKKTHDRIQKYTNKLNPQNTFYYTSILTTFLRQPIEKIDQLYFDQFKYLKIDPWPMFQNKNEENHPNIISQNKFTTQPLWNIIQRTLPNGDKSLFIINETDLKQKEVVLTLENDILNTNSDFANLNNLKESKENLYLDKKENFTQLDFSKINISQTKYLIIFSRGIKDKEFELLKPFYSNSHLKGLFLIESSHVQFKNVISQIPVDLEQLRLYDIPILGASIGKTLGKLKKLNTLYIHAKETENRIPLWIDKQEMQRIMEFLPNTLESLSLIGARNFGGNWFPLKAAENFAKKNKPSLKHLRLLNFPFDERHFSLILNSLPLELESFIISSINSIQLEDFLQKRISLKELTTLCIDKLLFSLWEKNKIYLPDSIENLSLTNITGINDLNFPRIIFPENLKLKNVDLSGNNLNDKSLAPLLNRLHINVKNLILQGNRIKGEIFTHNTTLQKIKIENLSLESNPIKDEGVYFMLKRFQDIAQLNLSDTNITDISLYLLSKNKVRNLQSINLSDNHLTKYGVNIFMEKYFQDLVDLSLNNILSIDIKTLSNFLTNNLKSLFLEGNILGDSEITLLSSKLPKELHALDISGSRMGALGAKALATNMPKLSSLSFDFRFGQNEWGLRHLFSNLSPYLSKLSHAEDLFSYENCLLISQNMPKYLYQLVVPRFEKEECKIILNTLPKSLRILSIIQDLKSQGKTLSKLEENLPSQLSFILWGTSTSAQERDTFIKNIHTPNHPILHIINNPNADYTNFFVKITSTFRLQITSATKIEDFKNVQFPTTARFSGIKKTDIPKGLLNSLDPSQLQDLTHILLCHSSIQAQELLNFVKKLPPYLLGLQVCQLDIQLQDVPHLIQALPKKMNRLNVGGNTFGEEGIKQFNLFKKQMEEKTGLPFKLDSH